MRIVFAGTPGFAVPALEALHAAGHVIVRVLTQPDRPAGRGLAAHASAVKLVAARLGVPVAQPPTLRDPAALDVLRADRPDLLVVAAYGLILPQAALDIPRLGAVNVHASLLPRWRGAAPIQRAILAGDAQTGVCIMRMEAGLDTGPVLLSESVAIAADDTGGSLQAKLAALGGRLVTDAVDRLGRGVAVEVPQPAEGVTYAAKLAKDEAWIDWREDAAAIERRVRAFDPTPGAATQLDGGTVKVWQARLADGAGAPGEVLVADRSHLVVACGTRALALAELQRAGGKRLPAAAFLAGTRLAPGRRFTVCVSSPSSSPAAD
jgi:methionyl-tRNA formyltransferase